MLRSRIVSQSSRRFVSSTSTNPQGKTHTFRNLVWKATLVTATGYGIGVFASQYNDHVEELFVDHIPFGEQIITLYDNVKEIAKAAESELANTGSNENKTLLERIKDLSTKKIPNNSGVQAQPVSTTDSKKQSSAATTQVAKQEEIKAPVQEIPMEKLSLHRFKMPSSQSEIPELAGLIKIFNDTIDTINNSDVKSLQESIGPIIVGFEKIQDTLEEFSKINPFEEAYKNKVADLEKEFGFKTLELQQKLTGDFIEKLNDFQKNLSEKSSSLLNSSIKANEEALTLKQNNQITLLSIKQVEEFNKILKEKLDLERDGRLSKLNELNDSVNDLSKVVHKLDKYIISREASTKLSNLVSKLQKQLLINKEISLEELNKTLSNLKILSSIIPSKMMCGCKKCVGNGICECGCSRKVKLMDLAIQELETTLSTTTSGATTTTTTQDSNIKQSILSNEQLYNRWFLISDELQTASLLPENAGVLGQLSAKIFSKLLFTKSGVVASGESMEDVIARVGEFLKLNKLDSAVEEVTQLQGWSRIVCDDWLQSARLKLEVQTLVDVIESDVKSL